MRKWLYLSILALAGLLGSTNTASAYGYSLWVRPYYTPAAFPFLYPSGYYSNSYYYAWYYPWFANYNYAHGPYANWWLWGGYATYANSPAPRPTPALVVVQLPDDALLRFDGVPASGVGPVRTFYTTLLVPGTEYNYDLSAEVVRDGRVLRETVRVIVRAGQETRVTLNPAVK